MVAIRASELDRVLSCNGSLTLTRLVDPRAGEEAQEGNALHHASAVSIVRDLGGTAPDGLPEPDPAWPSLRFAKWISEYYVRHIRENAPELWSLETEIPLSYEFDGFILSGHIDCAAVSPDGTEAMGWDLKTGYDPVDAAEQNWQMLGYVVLLKRAYPALKKCTFFVVQPRNDEDEGHQRVSKLETLAGIDNFTGTLERSIKAAIANSNEVNSGRVQCKWCPAAQQCPATIQQRDLMKATLTPELLATIKRTPDDATLADWVLASKTLARPMEDAETLAKERIAENGSITARDGTVISVKTQRGSYKILDPVALWNSLAEMLPEAKRALCAKWSMSTVKDQIAEHMAIPKTGKSAVTAESVFDAKMRPHVEQGERKLFQFQ